MAQLLFIGGLGSNPLQVEVVAQMLSRHYSREVFGIPFSDAQQDLAHVARLVRGNVVITHSAGMLLLESMTPAELIAIAPPMPTSIPLGAWRAALKTIALLKSGSVSSERSQKVLQYHYRIFYEHITRPHYNVGQAMRICQFNPAQLAVKMINRGTGVTLGFMSQDLLYPKSAHHTHVDMARRSGAVVHEDIEGHHDEFILYPLEVLRQINRL